MMHAHFVLLSLRLLQVVYISDVGAAHKAVFIALASTTAVLFFVTISLDFLLRHMKRIPKRLRRRYFQALTCTLHALHVQQTFVTFYIAAGAAARHELCQAICPP